MKTVGQIKYELEQIQQEIKFRLELFLKANQGISISMEFNTESNFLHTISGERELYSKEIKSELNITID